MNRVKQIFIVTFSLAVHLALPRPCHGQMQASLRKMIRLPEALKESSGLVVAGPNLIWSHEDSGNENILYGIDTSFLAGNQGVINRCDTGRFLRDHINRLHGPLFDLI